MLAKLSVTILVPAAVGMMVRSRVACVAAFVKNQKERLTLSSHVALACIPFMKVGSSHAQIVALDPASLVGVVLSAVVLHCLLLVVLFTATLPFPAVFPPPVRKAVVILGSEKTLPVAMAVLAFLPADLGEKGLIAVPCILGHLSQLLIDAVVAAKWAALTPDPAEAAEAKPEAKAEDLEAAKEADGENLIPVNGDHGERAVVRL